MIQTESVQSTLGAVAPDFSLLNTVTGKKSTLNELISYKATVVMFICNHCPFVKHINKELVKLASAYMSKGISFIAISSSDIISHPEDGPEKMKELAENLGYPFPYLFDESQKVAKSYDAVCTPDFFIYDKDLKLVYHGQLDDSRPANTIPVTGKDIRSALDSILQGNPVSENQNPSIGCSIKWKK